MRKLLLGMAVITVIVAGLTVVSVGLSITGDVADSGQPQDTISLQDSNFANVSYLISGDTLSPEAKMALTGFSYRRVVLADGSVNITLTAIKPNYLNQSFVIEPGQSLYFIEKSLRDDANDTERFPADDGAVIVDSNGYIIGP